MDLLVFVVVYVVSVLCAVNRAAAVAYYRVRQMIATAVVTRFGGVLVDAQLLLLMAVL